MSIRTLVCLTGLVSVLAVASPARAQAPAPTAQHKSLQYFVGTWTNEGDVKPSPYMKGGKLTATDTCEAFPGGFHVTCRSKATSDAGELHTLVALSYVDALKTYSLYSLNSVGLTSLMTGSKKGSVWTFTTSYVAAGAKMETRYTVTEKSATSYTYKWEMGPEGQLTTVMEGKATKTR